MPKENVWSDLHKTYKDQAWIDKPSIFAEQATKYFPKHGKLLELGAGQGQDSRFFAEHGYHVLSTDIEDSALEIAESKSAAESGGRLSFQRVDIREGLPFEASSFDIVYAHLSLHYFDYETTLRLIGEIDRILKPGGTFAFLVNSVNDPEYNTGEKLEEDYFQIDKTTKRYFSLDSTKKFTKYFETILLDDSGETYKDRAKGVHNLIRYIGTKELKKTDKLPTIKDIEQLHHKYAPNEKVYELVYGHCQIVAEIALWCISNLNDGTKVNKQLLQTAALLHDIGTYAFFDDNGKNLNDRLYPQHAILGSKILEDEGIDKQITNIVATHVLLGLTEQEIVDVPWPLPKRNYEPTTLEGELLCYADRFHSKSPTFNAYDSFLERLKQNLPLQGKKFETWSKRFGVPDIPELAKKYDQPIR